MLRETTLARRLARILATEHVELDSLYWGPEWTPRPDFIQNVLAIAQQPRWVIDGNYSAVRDIAEARRLLRAVLIGRFVFTRCRDRPIFRRGKVPVGNRGSSTT